MEARSKDSDWSWRLKKGGGRNAATIIVIEF
jgi:hypothetical protein